MITINLSEVICWDLHTKCIITSGNLGLSSKVCGANDKVYLSSVILWENSAFQHRFYKERSLCHTILSLNNKNNCYFVEDYKFEEK